MSRLMLEVLSYEHPDDKALHDPPGSESPEIMIKETYKPQPREGCACKDRIWVSRFDQTVGKGNEHSDDEQQSGDPKLSPRQEQQIVCRFDHIPYACSFRQINNK